MPTPSTWYLFVFLIYSLLKYLERTLTEIADTTFTCYKNINFASFCKTIPLYYSMRNGPSTYALYTPDETK
jgi:hypothetical protein